MAIPASSFGNTGSGAEEILVPLWVATAPEGITSLTTRSKISKVKDTCVCEGGWWTALSPVLLVSQQGGAPGGWQEPGRGVALTLLW